MTPPRPPTLAECLLASYCRLLMRQSVIVAGLGRCGTTLVYRSLKQYGFRPHATFLVGFDDVATYPARFVYKTHAFPPPSLPGHVRLVYMFGNPMNIAVSTHARMNLWGRLHHRNLGSERFAPNDCVLQSDTLLLSEHFDLWHRSQCFSFATVKYEALHEPGTLAALNDYLGVSLTLPPFKKRTANWTDHPQKDKLLEIYGDLYRRIEQADNIKVWPARVQSEEVSLNNETLDR